MFFKFIKFNEYIDNFICFYDSWNVAVWTVPENGLKFLE